MTASLCSSLHRSWCGWWSLSYSSRMAMRKPGNYGKYQPKCRLSWTFGTFLGAPSHSCGASSLRLKIRTILAEGHSTTRCFGVFSFTPALHKTMPFGSALAWSCCSLSAFLFFHKIWPSAAHSGYCLWSSLLLACCCTKEGTSIWLYLSFV